MNWLQLGGSLAGVALVVLVAWALKLGGGDLGEAEAMAEAEAQVAGLVAVGARREGDGWLVDADGGQQVRLQPLGARWVAIPSPALRSAPPRGEREKDASHLLPAGGAAARSGAGRAD